MRTVTTFDRVTFRATKSLPCPGCGRLTRRQKTFGQTLNPYNRTKLGLVKTREQIMAELRAEAARWQRVPERHENCSGQPSTASPQG
jgi:hypothetical protein